MVNYCEGLSVRISYSLAGKDDNSLKCFKDARDLIHFDLIREVKLFQFLPTLDPL